MGQPDGVPTGMVKAPMKILVLSFYYQPDLSAGAFRATALVRALLEQLPAGGSIEIITTRPNRYSTFSVDVPAVETHGPVTIRRIALPPHRSGMLDQSRAFVTFARAALRLTRGASYAVVFATSSRLMTAVLGSLISRRLRAPLYLDIRDIFVDTMKDVLPARIAWAFQPALILLERFAVRRATTISLVSEGFREYFESRYSGHAFRYFTNGIDDEFMETHWEDGAAPVALRSVPVALYAGNMGDGQGLHAIVPGLASALTGRVHFRLIGDGGRRALLERELAASGVSNVTLVPPVSRRDLTEEYRKADILFLHLNDYDAFRKVLPSKIFEYAATGKPLWAGVAGYSAEFLAKHVTNAGVFAPCSVPDAVASFNRLSMTMTPRAEFIGTFSRRAISSSLAADVLRVGRHAD